MANEPRPVLQEQARVRMTLAPCLGRGSCWLPRYLVSPVSSCLPRPRIPAPCLTIPLYTLPMETNDESISRDQIKKRKEVSHENQRLPSQNTQPIRLSARKRKDQPALCMTHPAAAGPSTPTATSTPPPPADPPSPPSWHSLACPSIRITPWQKPPPGAASVRCRSCYVCKARSGQKVSLVVVVVVNLVIH
jgi:hypothetical protein